MIAPQPMMGAGGPPLAARDYLPRAAIVWAALCAMITVVNIGNILNHRFPDPDDVLRLVQVRDLLAGQGWFDLHQYRIDPPAGTLMHWSRLVDVPLALIIGILTPLLGSGWAEQVAVILVPMITLGAIVAGVAFIASRFFDRETVTLACLTLGFSPWMMVQVLPMRIDHHGWQILCLVLAMPGLLPGWRARGAAWSGLALAAGLSISLELLPITLAFGGAFALRWLVARDSRSLPTFLAALTGGLALLFLATRGLSDLATHCDAVSPAHLAMLAVTAAAAMGVARRRPRALVPLVGLLGIAAAAGAAVFLWIAPECAAGPFAALDPLVRSVWLANVLEGRPAWHAPAARWVPELVSGLVALAVLIHLAATRPEGERRWWREYAIVFAAALIGGMLVWRSQSFVGGLAAVPLGWLMGRLLAQCRARGGTMRKTALTLMALPVLMPGFPSVAASALSGKEGGDTAQGGRISASSCQLQEYAPALARFAPATLFAPLDIGPSLLAATPHSVVATGHHRAATAMHDVITAFMLPADRARGVIARHGADYVVLCTDLSEPKLYARKAPGGLASDLMKNNPPAWLERVEFGAPDSFRVWRVRQPGR